jgi:hypothetical protein
MVKLCSLSIATVLLVVLVAFLCDIVEVTNAKPAAKEYEAIDPHTFRIFESLWKSTHESWLSSNLPSGFSCFNSSAIIFPVCSNGVMLNGDYYNQASDTPCSDAQCIEHPPGSCIQTPTDSMDYIPVFGSTEEGPYICEPPADTDIFFPAYGLDEGIAPLFTPVTPYRLDIVGTVAANYGDKCMPVEGVTIEAWQIDPTALKQYTADSEYQDLFGDNITADRVPGQYYRDITVSSRPHPTSPKPASLRDISCTGRTRTDGDGIYNFSTSMPPSYGPPRNIAFRITAPGFHTLYTRIYFDRDGQLQQLTGSADDQPALIWSQFITAADRASIQYSPVDSNAVLDTQVNTLLQQDPRVVKLFIEPTGDDDDFADTASVFGRFVVGVDFVLTPTSQTVSKDPSSTPMDIRGLWSANDGGLINVETLGTQFIAAEYPHRRSWGQVTGIIQDDAVRGVNFFNPMVPSDWIVQDGQGIKSVTTNADTDRLIEITPLVVDGAEVWPTKSSQLPDHLRSVGLSTGLISPADDFASTAYEMSIRWTGGGYNTEWSKLLTPEQYGYRFFKLVITRDVEGFPGGKLVINEIELFSGILAEEEYPNPKMKTPRTPQPMTITCSSYQDSDSHCYKAFDGDVTSNSAWVTDPVGDRNTKLTVPQWVQLDLGPGHYMRPTAMRIFCDVGGKVSIGCPRTFALLGSRDNQKFDVIYSNDMYDYNNTYDPQNGQLFTFFWEHAEGRANGHICGSCDTGPAFTCSRDAYDATCASAYCNVNGICDEAPTCHVGEYFDFSYVGDGEKATHCLPCPSGRYGNSTTLTSPACSGLCTEGYYCPPKSSTPTQYECGGPHVICPRGSAAPTLVSMGKYSVASLNLSSDLTSQVNLRTRYLEVLCPPGYYCTNGSAHQCPVGVFGNFSGLATSSCSDSCRTGQVCRTT